MIFDKEKYDEFIEMMYPHLKDECIKYYNSGNALVINDENLKIINSEIARSKYLYFIGRKGKVWTFETESGIRFPVHHVPVPKENPFKKNSYI